MDQESLFGGSAGLYEALAAPFASTYEVVKGGRSLTYIAAHDIIERLNEVLGIDGWEFHVIKDQIVEDHAIVLGRLTVWFEGRPVVREQWGGQAIARTREGRFLDLGDAMKGAASDALKKSAMNFGVGLYLSDPEQPVPEQPRVDATAQPPTRLTPDTARAAVQTNGATQPQPGGTLYCMECNEVLQEIRFKDGTSWTPQLLASYGQRKHGKTLCMQHYRAANERLKANAAPAPQAVSAPEYQPEPPEIF